MNQALVVAAAVGAGAGARTGAAAVEVIHVESVANDPRCDSKDCHKNEEP